LASFRASASRRVAFVVALIVFLGGAAVAHADPTGDSLAALRQQFGLDATRADFVVTIDVSGSMSQEPGAPYPGVKAAYQGLVRSVPAGDSVGLITFGTTATDAYLNTPLNSPAERQAAIDALPPTANQQNTDIGAGIKLSLDRLERPSATYVQTLVFMTDGKHQPPRGSEFPTTEGAAWNDLRARADKLTAAHKLLIYGIGLGSGESTDINILRTVFPDARIVSAPSSQLPALFKDATDLVDLARLKKPVLDEVLRDREGIKTAVTAPAKLTTPLDLQLVLTNTLPHLPVSVLVRGVTVTDRRGHAVPATIDAPPQRISVPAGGNAALVVHARPDLQKQGRRIGQEVREQDFSVRLDATARPEPVDLLEKVNDGQPLEVKITEPNPVTLEQKWGWVLKAVLAVIALVIIALVSAYIVYRRRLRLPPLSGSIVEIGGQGRRLDLSGTKLVIPSTEWLLPAAGNAAVELFTKRGRPNQVFMQTKRPVVKATEYGRMTILVGEKRLNLADSLQVGGAQLRYTQSSES